ncbi:Cupredoxin [Cylindrobasidium torrendii FP15055 ss-10]|uniref:Cupredoxin n=1 Tax=Cylindrobasidium torrendii FP15055 ss-10 TaxID=1314674 RepID=A0A0D7BM18_9AGAR|nr:Cupredoxin [Cylindrobasidium torrendii FP15055 ss-10]
MRSFTAITALAVASLASAATIDVKAGADGLTFTPNSVTAAVGDTINFEFYPKNHTLTQSTFANPCTAMDGGVDSGFVPVTADATEHPVWSLTVQNASAPLWFYCAQGPHCKMGMVFAINPTEEKSIDKFVEAAKASEGAAAGGASGGSASASAPAAGSTTGASTGATSGSTGSSGSSGSGAGSTTGSTAGAGGASAAAASASASAGASQVGAASANANGAASIAGAPAMVMAAFFGVFSLLL